MEKGYEYLKLQYETAVQLYQHEDNLCWKKINHMLYGNAGIFALYQLDLFDLVPILFAVFVNAVFFLFLIGGTKHMAKRKRELCAIQEQLQAEVEVDDVMLSFKVWTLSMCLMLVAPIALILLWVIMLRI